MWYYIIYRKCEFMSENIKYKILTFIRYLGDSFFYPFFAVYLESRGLIKNEIGFILSISPLVGILINPIYSMICKNFNSTKRTLTIITIFEAIFILLITLSSNFILISILTVLIAIFGSTHYGLFDSLLSIHTKRSNVNYSSIRIFGSMAYIIGTTLGGTIIDKTNFLVCFSICAFLFVLSGVFYALICRYNEEKEKEEIAYDKISILYNKKLWFFIFVHVLIMFPLVCGDHFFSLYLESRGLNTTTYGLIYSYYVVVEVVLLYFLNKYSKKINNNILLIIAGFGVTLRLLVNGMYLPIGVVGILSCLRGISYACLLHVSFKKVVDIIGSRSGTFGIMLMTLVQSIFVMLFDNINGTIISNTNSYQHFYLLMSLISFIGLIITIIYYFKDKKEVKD